MINLYYRIKAYLAYSRAVHMAVREFKKTGVRQYVIRGGRQQLLVCDRRNFRILKRKHYIKKDATIRDLEIQCFYCTPYSNGSGFLTRSDRKYKRSQAISWFINSRKKK